MGARTPVSGSSQESDAQRRLARLNRWTRRINPFLTWLLRSPLHRLASGRLLLLSVPRGEPGETVTFPVGYAVDGDGLAVVSYRARSWWRSLAGGAPVAIRLRGRARRAGIEVLTEEPAVAAVLGRLPALLGRRALTPEETAEQAREMVIVSFTLLDE
jgi:hypothetical protein